jgi:hypothetical protein
MASRFLIQIVNKKTGNVVEFEPGLRAEADFVESCVQSIVALGVGLTKTQAHVTADIRSGIQLAILEVKGLLRTDG